MIYVHTKRLSRMEIGWNIRSSHNYSRQFCPFQCGFVTFFGRLAPKSSPPPLPISTYSSDCKIPTAQSSHRHRPGIDLDRRADIYLYYSGDSGDGKHIARSLTTNTGFLPLPLLPPTAFAVRRSKADDNVIPASRSAANKINIHNRRSRAVYVGRVLSPTLPLTLRARTEGPKPFSRFRKLSIIQRVCATINIYHKLLFSPSDAVTTAGLLFPECISRLKKI